MLSDNSIAYKLLDETFNFPDKLSSLDTYLSNGITSYNYDQIQDQEDIINKNYNKETYLYDIIVISKLYGIIYRLFYYHYNITLKKNNETFKDFIKNMVIKFASDNSNNHITDNEITLNKLFDLSDLKLNTSDINDYNTSIFNIGININQYNDKNDKYIPFYHYKKTNGTSGKLLLLSDFMTYDYDKINKLEIRDNNGNAIINTIDNQLIIYTTDSQFTASTLTDYYNNLLELDDYTDKNADNINNYRKQRIFLYLSEFNNILTVNDNIGTYLSNIKNKMYRYNIILYNSLIQYGLLNIKNKIYIYNNKDIFTKIFTKIFTIISSLNTFITSLTAYKELGYGVSSAKFLEIDLVNNKRDDQDYYDGIKKGIIELKDYLINLNIIETDNNITITINSKEYTFNINTNNFNVKEFLKSIKTNIDIIKGIDWNYSINTAKYGRPNLIVFNFLTTIFVITDDEKQRQTENAKLMREGSILGIENGSTTKYPITLYNDALFSFKDRKISDKIKLMQDTCNYIKELITNYYNIISKKQTISNQYLNFNYNLNDIENLNTNLREFNNYLKSQYKIQNKTITYDKLDIKDNNKVDINDINNYILSFSDISSKYKNEWNIYNKGVYYYRILLIISIIIFITIVIINNIIIDKNIIIYILIFIIILILTLILFIYKKPNKEHFYTDGDTITESPPLSAEILASNNNSYIVYKSTYADFADFEYFITLSDYYQNNDNIKIAKIVLGSSSYKSNDYLNEEDEKLKKLDDLLNSKINKVNANDYINNYNKKIEYYKIKSIELNDAIKVLKLTNIQNYYIILIIYITFVLVLLGIIIYYKYPDNLYSIIITISILFIIIIMIISIKIHKISNSDNDIFYWSNLKPSLLNEND